MKEYSIDEIKTMVKNGETVPLEAHSALYNRVERYLTYEHVNLSNTRMVLSKRLAYEDIADLVHNDKVTNFQFHAELMSNSSANEDNREVKETPKILQNRKHEVTSTKEAFSRIMNLLTIDQVMWLTVVMRRLSY